MLKFMLVVCALVQQAVSNSDQTGDASMHSCSGEKGEKVIYAAKELEKSCSKYCLRIL